MKNKKIVKGLTKLTSRLSSLLVAVGLVGTVFLNSLSMPVQAQSANPFHDNITTVFTIVFENHSWSQVNTAPYIRSLMQQYSYANAYSDHGLHPSEPNYIWMEAGDNLGITNDSDPGANHKNTTDHLVTQLKNANIPWKSYQEDITGNNCPISGVNNYRPKHNPMVFFDDVVGNPPSTTNQYCIQHVRPYTELSRDLAANTVSGYNYITPNMCNDMHDCSVATGDTWLANNLPTILNSPVYRAGHAVVFVTWDEGSGGTANIGMIAVSPYSKHGYASSVPYTRGHSSYLRTVQEIFNVSPFLRDAANQIDLIDLFNFTGVTGAPTPTSIPATPTLIPTATRTPTPLPTRTPTPTVPVSPTPTSLVTVAPTATPIPPNSCQSLPTTTGRAQTTVSLQAGTYAVWSRMRSPENAGNSYWLQVDNSTCFLVGNSGTITDWTWINYYNGNNSQKVTLNLTTGVHDVKLIGNAPDLDLDKIIFTSDLTCVPTGIAGNECVGVSPTVTRVPTPTVIPSATVAPTPTSTPIPTPLPSEVPPMTPTPSPTRVPTPTITPAPVVSGYTTIMAPIADTDVESDHPSTNFGHSRRLQSDGSPTKYIYIKFDLTHLSTDIVHSAKLRLYVIDSSSSSHTVKYVGNSSWGEYAMTWENRHRRNEAIGSFGRAYSGHWIEVDITSSVQQHVGALYSVAIETNGSDGVDFNSREASSNRPQLVLQ
jgi:acid phosphatase